MSRAAGGAQAVRRELHEEDIDGQELRYFENRDGKQSLGEQAVVNLPLIQAAVRELRDILDRLMERVARLSQEHVAATRTAECSRSDLIAIARIVGPKPSWTEDAFLERKADAMAQFGLSSKSFSKALDAVKASRELKNLIEVESDLLHLSEAKIVEIVALWLDANPPKPANTPPRMVNPASISFDDVMRYGDKKGALNRAVMKQLTVEEFADLQTIFYVGRDRRFGEEYPHLLETTLAAHRLAKERYAIFHHILSKKNFIDGLAAGLRRVGQPALGDKVAHMRDALRRSGVKESSMELREKFVREAFAKKDLKPLLSHLRAIPLGSDEVDMLASPLKRGCLPLFEYALFPSETVIQSFRNDCHGFFADRDRLRLPLERCSN